MRGVHDAERRRRGGAPWVGRRRRTEGFRHPRSLTQGLRGGDNRYVALTSGREGARARARMEAGAPAASPTTTRRVARRARSVASHHWRVSRRESGVVRKEPVCAQGRSMSTMKLAAVCLTVLALSSCSARVQASDERRASSREVLLVPADDSLHLYRRDDGRLADTLRVVLRDSASWVEMWSRLWGGEGPGAAPEVDFTRSMLVVASLGDQPYPTRWVSIDSVFV